MSKIYNGETVFILTLVGTIGSDCTGPYNVTLYKDFTVEEFIKAVAEGVDGYGRHEWGFIGIYDNGYYPFTDDRCKYRNGNIVTNNIPKKYLKKKIKKVRASGGWSCMNYCLTV